MKDFIWHNPRCSKSREALQILQDNKIEVEVIEYLKEVPSVKELEEVCKCLGFEPSVIVRTKEALYKELGLKNKSLSNVEWYKILSQNPKLIERAIVCYKGKCVVARPPKKVLDII